MVMRYVGLLAAFALAAAPAAASNYTAVPSKPSAQRVIHKGVIWNCGPDACRASTDESRPAVLCQGLAKRVGRIHAFLADGRRFAASELAHCNLSAKD
jgi:hypothetical protein